MSSEQQIAANSIMFVKGSAMAESIGEYDWSQTPLGEPSSWSGILKTVLSIVLTAQQPVFLWWGQELIQFYNDAYRPLLGTSKHLQALGKPGCECGQAVWETIEPTISAVMQQGETIRIEDGLLTIDRDGDLEECYFNYTYSPVRDESGAVAGVLCVCEETTNRVVGDRQLQTLRELAAQPVTPQTVEEACQLCLREIAKNPADLPFALLYLMDEPTASARLVGTAGIESGTIASPDRIELASHPWYLERVQHAGQAEYITDLATRFDWLPDSSWSVPPAAAIILPIERSAARVSGFLILALSPRRAFDENYRGFVEAVGSQVAIAIANVRAATAERLRAEAVAALARANTEFFSNAPELRTLRALMLSLSIDAIGTSDRLLDATRLEVEPEDDAYQPIDLAAATAELESTCGLVEPTRIEVPTVEVGNVDPMRLLVNSDADVLKFSRLLAVGEVETFIVTWTFILAHSHLFQCFPQINSAFMHHFPLRQESFIVQWG
ncbi:GAF domain-containing protein [Chamaesiphon sp.]|uniref:GAF domain-containing protein n=1 Tax=Chamaesiphon sp. TaxID=2814140 RepID=UPI003594732B